MDWTLNEKNSSCLLGVFQVICPRGNARRRPRTVVVALTNKKGYRLQLIHRDSLPPAYRNPFSSVELDHGDTRADVWADNKNLIFVANISLGVPPIPQLVAMDTGSSLLWVECEPCTSCSSSSRFRPLNSSTYSNFSCNSYSCDELYISECDMQNQCMYSISYADGTDSSGNLASEMLTLRTSDDGTDVRAVVFGCAHDHFLPNGLSPINGILGLNAGPLSLIKQLDITRFSYCTASLRDPFYSDNQLVLGDQAIIEGQSTPLEIYNDHYYLSFEGISVGDKRLDIDPEVFKKTSEGGGVIIDSGATFSHLITEVYLPLRQEVDRNVQKLFSWKRTINPPPGETPIMLCYYGVLVRDIQEFPVVTFHFAGGANLQLDVDSLFDQRNNYSYCMAITRSEIGHNIIGMKTQQYHNIGFDLAAMQLSIHRIDCGFLQD